MCSLNKKYHPFFEPLHKTAHLQAFLSFEVHLLSFLSNIDEKLSVLTLWPFNLVLFASLSSRRRSKAAFVSVANLDTAMTMLLKLLVSVSGDVTSAFIKTIFCRYDVTSTYIKTIVGRYDVTETEPARIRCVLVANQN